ncbi:hypothetical protein [Halovulum sp. GXIMD14793]
MSAWNDFSDAEEQTGGDVIPDRTIAKVYMKIKPGGHNDPNNGWTGDLVTRNDRTGSCYLDCEFTVMGGKYNKRKVWSLIGLHSPKGDKWAQMGRTFIRAALESARGIAPTDTSEQAMQARRINGLSDLDGLEFVAIINVQESDDPQYPAPKNVIQNVVPCTHKDYRDAMSGAGSTATPSAAASTLSQQASSTPAWAS